MNDSGMLRTTKEFQLHSDYIPSLFGESYMNIAYEEHRIKEVNDLVELSLIETSMNHHKAI